MATKIKFYLNEVEVNPPLNWREIGIELNFDKDKESQAGRLTITDFEFVRENSDIINKWITDGLNSGVGVFEGIPFRVEVIRNGVIEVPFNGYADLTQAAKFSPNRSTLRAIDLNGIDSLNDKIDSFTFEHLYNIGSINSNDFVWVPYILNSVPNYTEAAVAVLGVYVMVKEIKDVVEKIAEFIPELPLYYVFSTYIRLIIYILYLILLIIALLKLIKNLIALLIQPVKYHAVMSLKDQLVKGSEFLGYTFHCDFLNEAPFNQAYIMPQKYYNEVNKKNNQLLGLTEPKITQLGYYKGTFGDLLRECKKMFKARVIIKNNTELHLVRWDYVDTNNQYILPKIEKYQPFFTLNTDEFNANYLISFITDSIDKNTIQDYQGTSYQVILEPIMVSNKSMVLMKGLTEERINFALAKRKESLTLPESIMNDFLKVFGTILGGLVSAVNAVIEVLNTIIGLVNDVIEKLGTIGIKLKFKLPDIPKVDLPNLKTLFDNRIGMLKIENDIVNIPKIFIMDPGSEPKYNKIAVLNQFYLSAKYLYEEYHSVSNFLHVQNGKQSNQFYLKSFEKVPFTFNDYEKVKNNNAIFTSDNEPALIDSLKWNIWDQTADIDVRINKPYTNNLKITAYEPDGK